MRRATEWPRWLGAVAVVAATSVALAGCDDLFFFDPAPQTIGLTLDFSLAEAQEPLPLQLQQRVFNAVDTVRIEISDGPGTIFDQRVAVTSSPLGLVSDVVEVAVSPAFTELLVSTTLLDDSLEVFDGHATLGRGDGETMDVQIDVSLLPITLPAEASCGDLPSYASYADVSIADAGLEAAITSSLATGGPGTLTCEAVEAITVLAAPDADILALNGLQNLSGLVDLDLSGNLVTDISVLATLSRLVDLDLRSNPIRDIRPLLDNAGLAAGARVDLRGTEASCDDVFALAGRGVAVSSACDPTLLGYWSFDACDARDDSGNGWNGIVHGTPRCVAGISGRALDLDGVDDFVSTALSSNRQPLSISVWFRPDAVSGEQSIVDGNLAGNSGQSLILGFETGDATLDLQYHDGFFDTAIEVEAGQWHNAVGVWTQGRVILYLDGVFAGETSFEQGTLDGGPFRFGRHSDSDPQALDGAIDEVRIFGEGLTGAEVRARFEREREGINPRR